LSSINKDEAIIHILRKQQKILSGLHIMMKPGEKVRNVLYWFATTAFDRMAG
jgi:hypothetical protein